MLWRVSAVPPLFVSGGEVFLFRGCACQTSPQLLKMCAAFFGFAELCPASMVEALPPLFSRCFSAFLRWSGCYPLPPVFHLLFMRFPRCCAVAIPPLWLYVPPSCFPPVFALLYPVRGIDIFGTFPPLFRRFNLALWGGFRWLVCSFVS